MRPLPTAVPGVNDGGGGSHTPGTASSVWHSLPSPHPSFPLSPTDLLAVGAPCREFEALREIVRVAGCVVP